MSREIKFRARYRDTGKPIPDFMEDEPMANLNADALIVEQYTGLKDKNGVEIYEGDVLRYTPNYTNGEVYWAIESARFLIRGNGKAKQWPQRSIAFAASHGRILGNIYENPELLR